MRQASFCPLGCTMAACRTAGPAAAAMLPSALADCRRQRPEGYSPNLRAEDLPRRTHAGFITATEGE